MKDSTFKFIMGTCTAIVVIFGILGLIIKTYDIEFVDDTTNEQILEPLQEVDNNLPTQPNDIEQFQTQLNRTFTDEEISQVMNTVYFDVTLINGQQFRLLYPDVNNTLFPNGFNATYYESEDGLYVYSKISDKLNNDYIVYSLRVSDSIVTVPELFAEGVTYKDTEAQNLFNNLMLQLVVERENIDVNQLVNGDYSNL